MYRGLDSYTKYVLLYILNWHRYLSLECCVMYYVYDEQLKDILAFWAQAVSMTQKNKLTFWFQQMFLQKQKHHSPIKKKVTTEFYIFLLSKILPKINSFFDRELAKRVLQIKKLIIIILRFEICCHFLIWLCNLLYLKYWWMNIKNEWQKN